MFALLNPAACVAGERIWFDWGQLVVYSADGGRTTRRRSFFRKCQFFGRRRWRWVGLELVGVGCGAPQRAHRGRAHRPNNRAGGAAKFCGFQCRFAPIVCPSRTYGRWRGYVVCCIFFFSLFFWSLWGSTRLYSSLCEDNSSLMWRAYSFFMQD